MEAPLIEMFYSLDSSSSISTLYLYGRCSGDPIVQRPLFIVSLLIIDSQDMALFYK